MSKRVGLNFKCPGCTFTTSVAIFYPTLFKPSFAQFECSACKSTVFGKVSRPVRPEGPGQVHVSVKILKVSPELAAIQAEEAALKAEASEGERV